jgi:hypothetical protein
MPKYVYEGPGTSLSIAGRTLDRGQPTVLEGRAAEAAANHPDIHEYSVEAKPVALGRMNHAQLLALAAERGIAVADDATNAEIRAELEAQAS